MIYEDSYATPPYPLLYHTITENNIYKNIKFDTKKAGFTRPASTFFIIQLSNSRAQDVKKMLEERVKLKDIIILDTRGVSSMYANDGRVIIAV